MAAGMGRSNPRFAILTYGMGSLNPRLRILAAGMALGGGEGRGRLSRLPILAARMATLNHGLAILPPAMALLEVRLRPVC
jgi:hypothetical protein